MTDRAFTYWEVVSRSTSPRVRKIYPPGYKAAILYTAYIALRGFALQIFDLDTGEILEVEGKGRRAAYRLVALGPVRDGEVARLTASILEVRVDLDGALARIARQEGDMARLEVMLDSMLAEERYPLDDERTEP